MADHTKEPWLCDKRTVYALNKKWFNIFSAVVQDCRTRNSELEEAKIAMQDIGSARYHYDIVCNAIANAKGGAA